MEVTGRKAELINKSVRPILELCLHSYVHVSARCTMAYRLEKKTRALHVSLNCRYTSANGISTLHSVSNPKPSFWLKQIRHLLLALLFPTMCVNANVTHD